MGTLKIKIYSKYQKYAKRITKYLNLPQVCKKPRFNITVWYIEPVNIRQGTHISEG